ncbi:MAG: class I SAM-dependent methyltransferase [Planctomycetota bacterium]
MTEVYAKRSRTPYSFFRAGHVYLSQQQDRELLWALGWAGVDATSLAGLRIFEVGCGDGAILRSLVRWGAAPELCAGADIRQEAVDEARRLVPNVRTYRADCVSTDEPPDSHDLVVQVTMFSSVLDPERRKAIAAEMVRITRPGGFILWYDLRYDNPSNPDVTGIRWRELSGLFPGCDCIVRRAALLVPPIARRLSRVSRVACDLLYLLPFLRGHWLGVFRTRERAGA